MNEVDKGKLIHQLAEDAVNTGLSVLKITEVGLERVAPEDFRGTPQQDTVTVPRELFEACLHAFNVIPRKRLSLEDFPDTYTIAAHLEKLRR